MDFKIFFTVFTTVFFAEMGDKTQLAVMLFGSDKDTGKWTVFLAASLALVAASAIGIGAGAFASKLIPERTLTLVAGAGFVLIGIWTMVSAYH